MSMPMGFIRVAFVGLFWLRLVAGQPADFCKCEQSIPSSSRGSQCVHPLDIISFACLTLFFLPAWTVSCAEVGENTANATLSIIVMSDGGANGTEYSVSTDIDWGDQVRETKEFGGLLLGEEYEFSQTHVYEQASVYNVIPSGSVTFQDGISVGPLEDEVFSIQIGEDSCSDATESMPSDVTSGGAGTFSLTVGATSAAIILGLVW